MVLVMYSVGLIERSFIFYHISAKDGLYSLNRQLGNI